MKKVILISVLSLVAIWLAVGASSGVYNPIYLTSQLTNDSGFGTGDFKADGSVAMTGDLNAGGQSVTNSANLLDKDGSVAMTGDLNMGGNSITNVADPVNDQDVATKAWTTANAGGNPFYGTSVDYTNSFLGYPKLTLTTNMVTTSGNGTLYDINTFTNAFDDDFDTVTSKTSGTTTYGGWWIDLGAIYSGYAMIMTSNRAVQNVTYVKQYGVSFDTPVDDTTGIFPQHIEYRIDDATTDANVLIFPFVGRYINSSVYTGGANWQWESQIYNISVYGVTNPIGWTGFGGSLTNMP